NGINENNSSFQNFTWSNTARYSVNRGPHNLSLLLGQEVIRGSSRFMNGSLGSLISTDIASRYIQDALGDASTKSVSSSGSRNAVVLLREGRLQPARSLPVELHDPPRRLIQPRADESVGHLPGRRTR